MVSKKTIEIQKKDVTGIAKFWQDLIIGKNIKAAIKMKERTIGYSIKHPLKKKEPHSNRLKTGYTNNHGQKESKMRRRMAAASRKINRRR